MHSAANVQAGAGHAKTMLTSHWLQAHKARPPQNFFAPLGNFFSLENMKDFFRGGGENGPFPLKGLPPPGKIVAPMLLTFS